MEFYCKTRIFAGQGILKELKTLNIGRSSLYRALDDLANGGHILRDGNKFTVNKGENLQ